MNKNSHVRSSIPSSCSKLAASDTFSDTNKSIVCFWSAICACNVAMAPFSTAGWEGVAGRDG